MTPYDLPDTIRGLSRRDFLRLCGIAVAAGVTAQSFASRVAHALEAQAGKPVVLWLEGQDCAGCSVAFAGLMEPPIASVLLANISLRYHETLMAAAGAQADRAWKEAIAVGGYILVVEGSIPGADDRFCMVGGRPFREILLEGAANAAAVVAVGACAAFGGIPGATVSRGLPVHEVVRDRPVIKLSTCPAHPEQVLGAILAFLGTGRLPEMDDLGRPKAYYSVTVHDRCRRRPAFDQNRFLLDWNDPAQKDLCLMARGCRGPWSWSDCAIRKWNHGVNYCTDCGAGCQACGEPAFYDGMSPLFFPHGPGGSHHG